MRTYKVKTVTRDIEVVRADSWTTLGEWLVFLKDNVETHRFNISQVVSIELCAG